MSESDEQSDQRILYDMHIHTPLCGHAKGTLDEYSEVAVQRGLKGMVITCHNPTNDGWTTDVRMSLDDFTTYVDLVDAATKKWGDRLDIRLGLESDYYPGCEEWLQTLHGMAEFHHILASVHPQLRDYSSLYLTDSYDEAVSTYFTHLAEAAETGLYDTISHPDLIKILGPKRWDAKRFIDVICSSLDRIAAADVAMELNTSGLNRNPSEMHPGSVILKEMHERSIPVVLGSDAHHPNRVADMFEDALRILQDAGYSQTNMVLNRTRTPVAIDDAIASLKG